MTAKHNLQRILELVEWQLKMFDAAKNLKNPKSCQYLPVKGQAGLTVNWKEWFNVITKYFTQVFFKNTEPIVLIPPTQMRIISQHVRSEGQFKKWQQTKAENVMSCLMSWLYKCQKQSTKKLQIYSIMCTKSREC